MRRPSGSSTSSTRRGDVIARRAAAATASRTSTRCSAPTPRRSRCRSGARPRSRSRSTRGAPRPRRADTRRHVGARGALVARRAARAARTVGGRGRELAGDRSTRSAPRCRASGCSSTPVTSPTGAAIRASCSSSPTTCSCARASRATRRCTSTTPTGVVDFAAVLAPARPARLPRQALASSTSIFPTTAGRSTIPSNGRATSPRTCARRLTRQAGSMRIALISDIHGNRIALDAVAADAERTRSTSGGCSVTWSRSGPDPVATLERLTDFPGVRFVRGNTDRYVVTGAAAPHLDAVNATRRCGRSSTRSRRRSRGPVPSCRPTAGSSCWRRCLRNSEPFSLTGRGCWASTPRRVPTTVRASRPTCPRRSSPACWPALPPMWSAEDIPIRQRIGASAERAINLGSVSNPMTSDLRATYVIVDADRHGHRLTHRRVAYDHDAVIAPPGCGRTSGARIHQQFPAR